MTDFLTADVFFFNELSLKSKRRCSESERRRRILECVSVFAAEELLLGKHHTGDILDPAPDPVFSPVVSADTRQDKHFLAW